MRNIFARNPYVVRYAKITKPYIKHGLLGGGTDAAVCVAVFRDNPFGIVARDNWILTIDRGRIRQLGIGLDRCEDLGPFPELTAR